MTIQESLTALGQWDIDLQPTIPRETLDALAFFGHVAIIHGRVDPKQYGDSLLGVARYVGVLRGNSLADDASTKIPNDNMKISGVGMAMWLGDEDNKGSILENGTTFATGSLFPDVIRTLLPISGAVTEGALHAVAGTYSGSHQWQSPREAIQYVCQTMSTDAVPLSWRVNGDGTLDAGPESNLFVTTPTCVVVTRAAGEDMAVRAVPGSLDLTSDVEDFTTRIVLLAEGEGSSTATGSADIAPGDNPYKDLHGNPLSMTRLVSESDTAATNAATRAQLALSQYLRPKQDLRLSIQDYDVEGSFALGDYVYAYDPDKDLVDTSNEILFRGQRLNPFKIQITEITWGVTAEYTVAYRAADGTWYDLTDHIQTSDAGTYVTVGGFSRQITDGSAEPVGSRPNADTSIPGAPTLVEPFGGAAYLDARGFTRARVVVNWNAPNNTDGSTILDGDHYEIRYAVDTDMIYPASWSQISQVRWMDLQTWAQPFASPNGNWQIAYAPWGSTSMQLNDLSTGVGYDVQIRAVDKTGNTGAWSGLTTFVASQDNIPPSTPAVPEVAASRIAVQVTHQLGKASGGTFNLETDLHHLEIHVDYEPYFTPSATTLKAKVGATSGMIQAQIPIVATVQIEETSARYVRVVAVDITGNKSGPSDAATATALLIDDAHISDLTVSKVTAGIIGADFIVGARIKTADTGSRVELNSGGIGAWNAAGAQTVSIAAADGSVTIVGQLKSGTSGKRIEINPTSTFLPEIRWYADTGTDFGYINAASSGTDISLGMDSSAYDDGTGTQVISRTLLNTGTAEFAVVRSDTQARRGGYVWATASQLFTGYNRGSVDGGRFSADAASGRVGFAGPTLNEFIFDSGGVTHHTGQWSDFIAAGSTDGLFTANESFVTAGDVSVALLYGATMGSAMSPMVTFRHPVLRTWQVTASSNTGFTVSCGTSSGTPSIGVWSFRV